MRFLHTADWHIGRTIRGRSRAREFEAVLAEVIEIARAESVDAMLVCGDIWDTASPAPESDRIIHEALRECIGHGIQVVMLAGNHDSPRKLEALGLLSDLLGVQTQPYVQRPNAGGILTIEGKEHGHVARIAAVPFLTEGRLIDAAAVMGLSEDWFSAYADGAAAIYQAMCADFSPETVNILATHVFIDGARLATVDGSERRLHIGRAYGVSPAGLPTAPQYIALGHIHQPQELVDTPVPAAYSGSLLQLDFGERGQQKVVRIIDAAPGRPVQHHAVPLTKGRQLVELRGGYEQVLEAASAAGDAHLRVALEVEAPQPGLAERVRDALPSTVDVQLHYEAPPGEAEPEQGFAHLTPEELFARYYRATHQADPAPELLGLFRELYDDATGAAFPATGGEHVPSGHPATAAPAPTDGSAAGDGP